MNLLSASIPLAWLMSAATAVAGPTITKLTKTAEGFQLDRDGQPYFICGAGGDASKQILKDSGGNSFRTWGADHIDAQLDEANKLGLSVTVGIWLQHQYSGWAYSNPEQVKRQYEMAKAVILKYKENPAVLMWGIGNEMEGYKDGGDPKIWNAVQDIARFAHQVDPDHPTMTVVAEIGGKRISSINQYCPDIDVIAINSYGGGPSLGQRYRAAGGVKPFVVTEFGPPGSWESGTNRWGVPGELTSTAKGLCYRKTYVSTILAEKGKLCLGSYAFAWGSKREASVTWFGTFLTDGSRLEAVDELNSLWTGQPLVKHCPQIDPLIADQNSVKPGDPIHVILKVTDPQNRPLTVKWELQRDPGQYSTNGETQSEQKTYPNAIVKAGLDGVDLNMPDEIGGFWLYAFVRDDRGNAAVANIPLHVMRNPPPPSTRGSTLPVRPEK